VRAARKPYTSTRRRERAAETRRRLAGSARRLFRERGYAATTIAEIAADADLAVQTFYAVYGSKRAVLTALIDQIEENAELPVLLEELAATTDARKQLALIVDFTVRLFDRGADVLDILRLAASAEPDLAAVGREGDARRRRDQGRLVRGWSAQGALRQGLSEREAAEVLWAMTSPEVYRLFVVENRWSPRRFGEWLKELLTQLLFDGG
jgi:TetR/AcrR family transcriptional regulator, regulator of cefoperazone and chloramphenicol sensitivity